MWISALSNIKYKMITLSLASKELNSRDLQTKTVVNSPLYKSPLIKSQVDFVTGYIKIRANKCIHYKCKKRALLHQHILQSCLD